MAQGYHDNNSASNEDDVREIWLMIRGWIAVFRVILVISIIIVAEIFEEALIYNMSLSVWAIIVGFPLFLLLSVIIIQGDKRFAPDLEIKRRERVERRS